MLLRSLPFLLLATAAFADDAQQSVRAALEENLPAPSSPLQFPSLPKEGPRGPAEVKAENASRGRADEVAKKAQRAAQGHLKAAVAAQNAQRDLGQAGQSANAQSRAENAKNKEKAAKGPRGPKQ